MRLKKTLTIFIILTSTISCFATTKKTVTPVFKIQEFSKNPTIILDTASIGKAKLKNVRIYYSTSKLNFDSTLSPCSLDNVLTEEGIVLNYSKTKFDKLYIKVRVVEPGAADSGAELLFRAWNFGWLYGSGDTPKGAQTDYYPTSPDEYYGLSLSGPIEVSDKSRNYAQFCERSSCYAKTLIGGKTVVGAFVLKAGEVLEKNGLQWKSGNSYSYSVNHPAIEWSSSRFLYCINKNAAKNQQLGFSSGDNTYLIDYFACLEQVEWTPESKTVQPEFVPASSENSRIDNFSDVNRSLNEIDINNILTSSNHPRIFLNDSKLETVKAKIGKDRVMTKLHYLILEQAEESLKEKPLSFKLDASGRRILDQSRAALQQLLSCSYAYRITGDRRFLIFAEERLDMVCSFPSWNARHHALDMGEMATAVGICYDWLYPSLSNKTKMQTEKALKTFALDVIYDNPKFHALSAISNWGQVCSAGPAIAALAIYETCPDIARGVLETCVKSNLKINNKIFAPDGNTGEGYTYWCYGAGFQAIMNYGLESTLNFDIYDNIKGISKTAGYYISLETPSGYCFNYSDTSPMTLDVGVPVWYYAYKNQDCSLLYNEIRKLFIHGYYDGQSEILRILTLMVPWVASMDFSKIEVRRNHIDCFGGINPILTCRSGWNCIGNETDCFCGLKAGSPSNSHGHMDIGSFVFDSQGERWACDFVRPAYAPVENALKKQGGSLWDMTQNSYRWKLNIMNNRYHNTLTINNTDQIVSANCIISDSFDKGNEYGGTVDLSPAYSGEVNKLIRTIKIVDNSDLIVIDSVTTFSDKPAEIEWRMMTPARPVKKKDGFSLTKNGKTLNVSSSLASTPIEWCEYSLNKQNSFDSDLSKFSAIGFKTTVSAGTTAVFITKLSPGN